ncbi:MAG: regulatory protein RecX [Microbacteriaceae bacterium]
MNDITNPGETVAPVTFLPWVRDDSAPIRQTADVLEELTAQIRAVENRVANEPEVELSPAELKAARKAERRSQNVSLHALTRRAVSVKEMRELLHKRELDQHAIDDEIARLENSGLLNDNELAVEVVRRSVERKGLGRNAIRSELVRRKLSHESIEFALEGIESDDESERIVDVARARFARLGGLDRDTQERRLTSFLMRRGYRSSDITRTVRQLLLEDATTAPSTVRFH